MCTTDKTLPVKKRKLEFSADTVQTDIMENIPWVGILHQKDK